MFRRIYATTIALLRPDKKESARAGLGHARMRTTDEWYIVADGVQASEEHQINPAIEAHPSRCETKKQRVGAYMRAVIYARYSSDNQREASIDDQIHECKKLIKAQGWKHVHTHFDKAISGATHHRPRLSRNARRCQGPQI
jgi:hypothetical protein